MLPYSYSAVGDVKLKKRQETHRRGNFGNGTKHGNAVLCTFLYFLSLHCKRRCVVAIPRDLTLLALPMMSTRKDGISARDYQCVCG